MLNDNNNNDFILLICDKLSDIMTIKFDLNLISKFIIAKSDHNIRINIALNTVI